MTGLLTSAISPSALSLNTLQHTLPHQPAGPLQDMNDPVYAAFERVRGKTGIVPSHLVPLQRIAAQTNSIIGVRPVEAVATGLIENGHPTKDYHIKGKSANWGPQAGLICKDQAFSKLEKFKVCEPEKVARANRQVEECIKDKHAVAIPLKLSRNRLGELIQLGQITQLAVNEQDGTLRFNARAPSQEVYAFEGKRTAPTEDSYAITHKDKPVEVLAKSETGKALTADYDLHMVAPHLSDFGSQDKIPVPDIAHSVFTQRIDRYRQQQPEPSVFEVPEALRADYEDTEHFYRKEDFDLGNATQRITDMIKLINHQLVGDGERVVHHNADSGSPATDVAANYPATFFLPTRLGRYDEICIINDRKEMAELIRTAKDSGYHVPLNPLWESEVNSIKRSGFVQAQGRLASAFGQG
jgi:adenylate cyclase ExoY